MVSTSMPKRSFAINNHASKLSSGAKSNWCSARSILLPAQEK
jgi:hypothetical protein